jgi:hypothetical protein
MATTVAQLITRTQNLTLDIETVRWTANELLQWVLDAQFEIVTHKPSAITAYEEVDLVAGTTQVLPADCTKLMNVLYNSASKLACTRVIRNDLDRMVPGWAAANATVDAEHFMVSDFDNRGFAVYPPNTGTGSLACHVGKLPTVLTTVNDNISVTDDYVPAVVDYMLYRIWSKQTSNPQNLHLADRALEKFYSALGVKSMNTTRFTPRQGQALERDDGIR